MSEELNSQADSTREMISYFDTGSSRLRLEQSEPESFDSPDEAMNLPAASTMSGMRQISQSPAPLNNETGTEGFEEF